MSSTALGVLLCTITLAAYDKPDQPGAWQAGWDRGYRKGLDRGISDRAHKYDLNTKEYKRADSGYEKRLGKKDEYKRGFREGYRAGYDESFHGRAARTDTRDVADRSNDAAYDAGYRDGLRAGDEDFRQSRDFRPDEHDEYREAERGHTREYGDKRVYANRYREGFVEGYRDGYRGRR